MDAWASTEVEIICYYQTTSSGYYASWSTEVEIICYYQTLPGKQIQKRSTEVEIICYYQTTKFKGKRLDLPK